VQDHDNCERREAEGDNRSHDDQGDVQRDRRRCSNVVCDVDNEITLCHYNASCVRKNL
jgi:hypothetical protein